MPRDGSGIYTLPAGTLAVTDTSVESSKYNNFTADLATDLNTPRPIVAGGTGATSAAAAMATLGGELAKQVITNYNADVFQAGSFYSATSATNPPVSGHAFIGICYVADANNMAIQARDQSDSTVPGRLYIREKKAGVWSAWYLSGYDAQTSDARYVAKGGDTMTGNLVLNGDPSTALGAVTKQYADGISGSASNRVLRSGDTMTGPLVLSADPGTALGAATKQYVDGSGVFSVGITPGNGISVSGSPVTSSGNMTLNNTGVVTVKSQVFASSGTYTPSAGMIHATIECWGGGGGGGGVVGSTGYNLGGAGGGAGGYSRKTVTAATVGASQTVTIGAGGTVVSADRGNSGGDTSVGTLCVAKGGSGGGYNSTVVNSPGGGGGLAGTGDIAARGAVGGGGFYSNSTNIVGLTGNGGATSLGGNGLQPNGNGSGGPAIANSGSGGSGGLVSDSGTNLAGGAGGSGLVIITEFNKQ